MIRKTCLVSLATIALTVGIAHAQQTWVDPLTTTCAEDYDASVRNSIGGLATFLPASADAERWTTDGPGIFTPALPGISIKIPADDLALIQKHNLPVWVAAMFLHTDHVSEELLAQSPGAALKGFTMNVVYATRHSGCKVSTDSLVDFTDASPEIHREMLFVAYSIKQYGVANAAELNSAERTRISRLPPISVINEVETYLNDTIEAMKDQ
ncbi:MAG: hypothetical protein EOP02_09525 [Proteobacteria bacterium]|nr:MAG: hypothetical protein EOP02_09525 [Pseudomonadota bacterium]